MVRGFCCRLKEGDPLATTQSPPSCRTSGLADPQLAAQEPEAQAEGSRSCSAATRQGTPGTSLTFPEPHSPPKQEQKHRPLMTIMRIQRETDTGCVVLARDRSTRPWLRGTATPGHTFPSVARVHPGGLTARTSLVPGVPQPRCGGSTCPFGPQIQPLTKAPRVGTARNLRSMRASMVTLDSKTRQGPCVQRAHEESQRGRLWGSRS